MTSMANQLEEPTRIEPGRHRRAAPAGRVVVQRSRQRSRRLS
jgi:hypothetical protein